jgi:replicative DNA helicase
MKNIFRVQRSEGQVPLKSVGEIIESKIGDEILERAKNITKRYGISTGYATLDNLLRGGGLLPGLLYVVAGRPGMGKTTFLLNLAYNCAKQGVPTVVFSLELSNARLIERLAYMRAGINHMEHWMTGTALSEADIERLRAAMRELQTLPLLAKDTAGMRPSDIVRTMDEYKDRLGIQVMCVDYLHIMRSDQRIYAREREIGTMVETIRDSAKTLGVACVLACQLNREVEESAPFMPALKHLRDSGAIEQVAYCVWALYRKDYYLLSGMLQPDTEVDEGVVLLDNLLQVAILKQQDGPMGTAVLSYEAGTGKVDNVG